MVVSPGGVGGIRGGPGGVPGPVPGGVDGVEGGMEDGRWGAPKSFSWSAKVLAFCSGARNLPGEDRGVKEGGRPHLTCALRRRSYPNPRLAITKRTTRMHRTSPYRLVALC